jgi:hypothetical protein
MNGRTGETANQNVPDRGLCSEYDGENRRNYRMIREYCRREVDQHEA